jgi:hypothetical protein
MVNACRARLFLVAARHKILAIPQISADIQSEFLVRCNDRAAKIPFV